MALQTVIDKVRRDLDLEIEQLERTGDEEKARDFRSRRRYLDALGDTLPMAASRRVFVSYHAGQKKYFEAVKEELQTSRFEVITGFDPDERANMVTETVLFKIRKCAVYVGILTPDLRRGLFMRASVPSPWTLVEQGMAIALGKRYVMMTHKDVDTKFCVDGGKQRIEFTDWDLEIALAWLRRRVLTMYDETLRHVR
jgi:hypothetical protein